MDSQEPKDIVVGVDGSAPSKAALRWALQQASLTGADVRAVGAWEFPAFYSWEGGPMPPEDFEQASRKALNDAVDEALRNEEYPVRIYREVVHGHSAQVLLDQATEAGLLIVGSRGHGSFYGALLGSVSQQCAQHATCPVVIVRE